MAPGEPGTSEKVRELNQRVKGMCKDWCFRWTTITIMSGRRQSFPSASSPLGTSLVGYVPLLPKGNHGDLTGLAWVCQGNELLTCN
eukprot:4056448-Lingulodinium_polyedra.AAC.1